MLNKILSLIFILFFSCVFIFAAKPPTMPNSYDGMSVSARSLAMGGAGVAMPGNIENIFYNSAGLAYNASDVIQAETVVVVSRTSDLLPQGKISEIDPIELGFTSFAVCQKQGAISWRTLSYNEENVGNGTDWYKKQERIKAITVSAANRSDNGTAFGINLSYLYGTLSESSLSSGIPFAQTSSGNGFTMDVGFMAPLNGQLFFGVNLENIFGVMWWENYDFDQLPFGVRTGLGYQANGFSLLADWNKKFYRFGELDDNVICIGLEQYLGSILCVRFGAEGNSLSDKDKIKYTYGVGLNISVLSLSVSGETYKLDDENVEKYVVSLKVVI